MIKSNIEKFIDESPFKRAYIVEQLRISRGTLNNWCKEKSHPGGPQLFKLAQLLNKSMDDFYFEEEEGN